MPDRRGLILLAAAALALAGPVAAMPEAAAEHLAAAEAAARRADGIAAEAELRKAMTAGASRAEVAARMGEALLLQGDLRRAREWLGDGVFAAGEAGLGWRMMGRLLRLEGRLGEAGQAYDRSLQHSPNDALLWVDIARLRYLGGEHLLAIEAADRAVAADPQEPRALELQAQLLRDRAGPVPALPLFEKAVEAAPEDLSLLLGLAATQGEAGEAAAMLATTRQIYRLYPRQPMPFFFQAAIAARAGNNDLARNLLNRTTGRLADMPAAMLLQGALELEAGNTAIAVEVLERLDRKQPANPQVQLLYARALYAAGDHRRLHERFDGLASRPDAPAYLLLLLGRAYEEAGDRLAAAPLLDRAAAASIPPVLPIPESDPLPVLAARWRADQTAPGAAVPYLRKLLAEKSLEPASAAAARFLAARPGSADALALAGDAALARGDLAAAFAAYDKSALARYPEWLMLRATEALDKSGRGAEAAAVVARYATGFPNSLLAPRLLAGSAAFAGDWPRARTLLEHVNRRGGQRDVRLLADLSLAQLRTGDPEAALATAEAAQRLNRASPVAAQARGMALAALGHDADLAAALLAKAQRISGDNPLLREARGQLARR